MVKEALRQKGKKCGDVDVNLRVKEIGETDAQLMMTTRRTRSRWPVVVGQDKTQPRRLAGVKALSCIRRLDIMASRWQVSNKLQQSATNY
jgi:hypothetical protein